MDSGQDPAQADDSGGGQDRPDTTNEAAEGGANDMAAQLAQLKADNERMAADLSKVRDEAAKRRVAKREADEARARALQEQGEFKALAETQQAQIDEYKAAIADLEGLREKAASYDAWEKRELESIEAAKANLPEPAQVALDAAGSLAAKRAFLDALRVTGPAAKAAADAGAGAAASQPKAPSFEGLRGRALVDAINKDPQAFWQDQGASKKGSALGRMMSRRK